MDYKYIIIEGLDDLKCSSFEEVVKALIDENYYSMTDDDKKRVLEIKASANILNCNNMSGEKNKSEIVTYDEVTYVLSLVRLGIIELLERVDGRELTKDIDVPNEGNYVIVSHYAQQLLDTYQRK